MSQLTIYRASAGSGKTYTLTGEYLKILFKDPQNYQRILAVTFTNKATDEMKRRIINELYLLSKGQPTHYLENLTREFNKSKEVIFNEARHILGLILHDYSRFSVQTIDRFFHGVIQAFIREIGIQTGFKLELDNSSVLLEVIDRLMYDLDNKKELTNWLVRFAENRIEEGRSWNFKKEILSLANELFKENFKAFKNQIIAAISDKQFLNQYLKEIREFKSGFEDHLAGLGNKAIRHWQQQDLDVDDFKGKSRGVAGHFLKLAAKSKFEPSDTARKAVDTEEEWYVASSGKKVIIVDLVNNSLNALLKEAIDFYDTNITSYFTADVILRNVYTLGLLTDISSYVSAYTSEKNIFLISNAAEFIYSIIKENDTPFIYEKTGNHFNHFMMDEFQDTSSLQWQNFYPLIENSLASNHDNLIVGDVKQSIYRWRNSDWNILDNKLEKQFMPIQLKTKNLEDNWRSAADVILFNNAFFHDASVLMQSLLNTELEQSPLAPQLQEVFGERIVNAYNGLEQNIPEKNKDKKGYVQVSFVEDDDEDYREHIMENLLSSVEQLQDHHYALNDIAILVRTGREGKEVADYFVENAQNRDKRYRFNIISNDSLYVESSIVVKLILSVFRYLLDPKDKINLSTLVYSYQTYIISQQKGPDDLHVLFNMSESEEEFLQNNLSAEFIEKLDYLKKLSAYQLTEEIIKLLGLGDDPQYFPYLQAFQDVVLRYANDRPADLHSFLTWWDNTGNKETLSLDEDQDAIRILTIHKSKGLEFKAVLVPFCNWGLDHAALNTNFMWCQPQAEPFNKLSLVPVRYSSTLAKTHFSVDYFYEKMQTYVDNLNLLYVTFTRAINYLKVFCPVKPDNKNTNIKNVADIAKHILSDAPQLQQYYDVDDNVFVMGRFERIQPENKTRESEQLNSYTSVPLFDRFNFALHSNDYFTFEDNAESKLDYGKMMHTLFQKIKTTTDIENALDQMVFEGKLNKQEKEVLKTRMGQFLENPQVKNWFTPGWDILNERDILLKEVGVYRPDRVMVKDNKAIVVDYKFGDKENKLYEKQVKNYMNLIDKMGYDSVSGFVWYVNLEKVTGVGLE